MCFGEPSNNGGRVKYNSYQFKLPLPVNILEKNLYMLFFSIALSVLPMACKDIRGPVSGANLAVCGRVSGTSGHQPV